MSWIPENSLETSAPHLCLATALLALILLPFGQALAEPRLNVLGLYPGRAAISIDGVMRVLKSGETSPEGVHLLSASSREAVVSVEGRVRVLQPEGGRLEPLSESGPGQRVAIARNERGLFVTQGSINGMAVEMLVDTGASMVALGAAEAKRLGLDYRAKGQRIRVMTASGLADGWQVELDSIRIGDILERKVPGVVLEGQPSHGVLLGMSLLSRLNLNNESNILYLEVRD